MPELRPILIKQAVYDWLDAYETAVIRCNCAAWSPSDFKGGWMPNRATALDVALRLAEKGATVIYLSLDISLRHKLSAFFCEALEIEIWELTRCLMSKKSMERLMDCVRRVQPLQVFCCDAETPSLSEIGGVFQRASAQHGAQCVAADGLETLSASATIHSKSRLSDATDALACLKHLQMEQDYQAGVFAM